MSGISWIEYKGFKILYTDYGSSREENIQLLEEQEKYELIDTDLLILSDFTGTVITQEYMQKVKEYGKRFRKNRDTNVKNALLGITGVKKTLFDSYLFFTYDMHTRLFNDETEAKEWLIEDRDL